MKALHAYKQKEQYVSTAWELERHVAMHIGVWCTVIGSAMLFIAKKIVEIATAQGHGVEAYGGCGVQLSVVGLVLLWCSIYGYAIALDAQFLRRLFQLPYIIMETLLHNLLVWVLYPLCSKVLLPTLDFLQRFWRLFWRCGVHSAIHAIASSGGVVCTVLYMP